MIKINLAPLQAREEIKNKKIVRLLKQGLLSLLLLFTMASIIQLLGRNYLETRHAELQGQLAFNSKWGDNLKNKAQESNQQLAFFHQVKKESLPWTKIINYLASTTPAGIKYNSLNANTGSIEISGEAEDRQALLDYKQRMENDLYLKSGEFPVKNLFQKEDIPFSVKLEIKSYEIP